ncbi:MAG: GDP-mannose 4,6-dehydratase [Armatimonadota bacterium]
MEIRDLTALVAGGAGFIGSHLCRELLDRNCDVFCIDNGITGRFSNVEELDGNPRFHLIKHDIIDGPPDEPAAPDAIFNLACPASPTDFGPLALEIMRVSSEGTRHLLERANACGATFLQASTSEVYGEPLEHPQEEHYWGNVNTVGSRSCYDEGKRFAEAMLMNYRWLHELDARMVRIFNTYGPRMRPHDGRVVPNFIRQALNHEPLTIYGDGSQTRSFCYVSDTVAGILAVMEMDAEAVDAERPVYNVGNSRETTILDFARAVIDVCESETELAFQPNPHADDPARRCPDTSKLEQATGWRTSVDLRDGLAKTVAHFREHEMG